MLLLGPGGSLLLSTPNLLLMLCLHGTKHLWSKLSWIADLAQFTTTYPDLDWPALLEGVARLGFSRVVALGLHLAQQFSGARLPQQLASQIQDDPRIPQLAQQAFHNLLAETPASEQDQVDYYLRARERLQDRAYFILDQAFIPKQVDWTTISLPAALYPLYYLLRPLRLFHKIVIFPRFSR